MATKSDHDLLLEVHTTVNLLAASTTKLIDDHEKRLRIAEDDVSQTKGSQHAQGTYLASLTAIGTAVMALVGWFALKK